MRLVHRTLFFASLLLCVACSSAHAELIGNPLLEEFDSSAQNWKNYMGNLSQDATWISGGGPDGAGDAYIQSTFTTPVTGSASTSQVVFRARDTVNSSDNIFFGDWTGGQKVITFSVRHNADSPLSFGMRLPTTMGFPAMIGLFAEPVNPNEWTQLTMLVNNTNPLLTDETGPTHNNFTAVFSAVNSIQIFANLSAQPNSTAISFDLDNFQVVPEPSTIAIAGMGLPALALAGARYRRRKNAGKSAA
ncbi:MAG: PEP-CTERM sorting domain-containing protein [Pirellulales bacterium]|nr:PEP-CTERM sorting domain-containing protein [Pirellulales bacterium]